MKITNKTEGYVAIRSDNGAATLVLEKPGESKVLTKEEEAAFAKSIRMWENAGSLAVERGDQIKPAAPKAAEAKSEPADEKTADEGKAKGKKHQPTA